MLLFLAVSKFAVVLTLSLSDWCHADDGATCGVQEHRKRRWDGMVRYERGRSGIGIPLGCPDGSVGVDGQRRVGRMCPLLTVLG